MKPQSVYVITLSTDDPALELPVCAFSDEGMARTFRDSLPVEDLAGIPFKFNIKTPIALDPVLDDMMDKLKETWQHKDPHRFLGWFWGNIDEKKEENDV